MATHSPAGKMRQGMTPLRSLYRGLAAENIDNAAHIGGLLCGFVLAVILSIGKSAHTQIGSDERFDGI